MTKEALQRSCNRFAAGSDGDSSVTKISHFFGPFFSIYDRSRSDFGACFELFFLLHMQ